MEWYSVLKRNSDTCYYAAGPWTSYLRWNKPVKDKHSTAPLTQGVWSQTHTPCRKDHQALRAAYQESHCDQQGLTVWRVQSFSYKRWESLRSLGHSKWIQIILHSSLKIFKKDRFNMAFLQHWGGKRLYENQRQEDWEVEVSLSYIA